MAVSLNLHLVRHGRTQWNEERRYLGHEDQGALMEGLEQLLPLREEFRSRHFAKVYCSDLLRCRQTLNCILLDLYMPGIINEVELGSVIPGVCYDRKLRELDFGDWEGKTYEDLKENAAYRRWIDNPGTVTPPSGESWPSFCSRIEVFLAEMYQDMKGLLSMQESPAILLESESESESAGHDTETQPGVLDMDVLVVTHGGVIRQIAAATLPDTEFWATSVSPGEVLQLQLAWDGARWRGVRVNE
ncbi:histidine phosphatase family protein [Paenibacillus glucanolyticus]|uniref:histidine phosphatase family protein n=1 Tax=Paenibacillus glucanolyticus TaxID=59843 RepID=UPI00128C45E2|nr:histidine phosphatase family protein [Paenibacillus glucanolyticus]MPY18476.1 histidine phosphatase family protein [Paenibacillus glucanolyticus]